MKRAMVWILAVGLVCLAVGPAVSMAATEAQKQAAIDAGLAWLAGFQKSDGRFDYYNDGSVGYGDVATTGAALLAYLEEGHTPTSGTAYSTHVANGLDFLFSRSLVVNISPQAAGNPDKYSSPAGANKGVMWNSYSGQQMYDAGIVLPAIVEAGKALGLSTAITTTAGTSGVENWTYAEVIGNAVDFIAYAQTDSGYGRGGWRYTPNGGADNSVSQWPAVALLYAEGVGITAPAFVKSELAYWTTYSQSTTNGSFGYTGPGGSPLQTGSGLVQLDYQGLGLSATQVQNALGFLNTYWNSASFGDYYGMWAIYKGVQTTAGLNDTTYITPRPQGGAVIDPGDTWNWYEDYCEYLVNAQRAAGNWQSTYGYASTYMHTPWAINILNATIIPDIIPEPATFAIWGGLIGLAFGCTWWRRRRKAA